MGEGPTPDGLPTRVLARRQHTLSRARERAGVRASREGLGETERAIGYDIRLNQSDMIRAWPEQRGGSVAEIGNSRVMMAPLTRRQVAGAVTGLATFGVWGGRVGAQ